MLPIKTESKQPKLRLPLPLSTMNSFTTTLLLLLHLSLLPLPSSSTHLTTEFIYTNFTATSLQFIDSDGAFLSSLNSTFKAAITNPNPTDQIDNFYFCVLHVESNQIIWTANRNSPISNSDRFSLTSSGISLQVDGQPVWSTPQINSSVRALQLQESGNLVLLDNRNRTVWQSFDHPTDTIVVGQKFPVGALLSDNASTGNYEFTVVEQDALLQWNGLTYWKLSMELSAFRISNSQVAYLMINGSGLYLLGGYQDAVVYQVVISTTYSGFRVAQLNYDGRFYVKSFVNGQWNQEFVVPRSDCQIPNFCGRYGLCTGASSGSNAGSCSCPSGFRTNAHPKGCLPTNAGSLPSDCHNGSDLGSSRLTSYENLSAGIDYFSNSFSAPTTVGGDILTCGNLCSKNCSCFGYFYELSSSSCYLLVNQLGSFFTTDSGTGRLGYIKTIVSSDTDTGALPRKRRSTSIALVLIPSIAGFILIGVLIVGFLKWRKSRSLRANEVKLGGSSKSMTDYDYGAFSIPGLPVRFDYDELDVATDNFQNKIGSGGFGDVYKGTLSDKSVVAVKKITNSTNQGKKDFCTEIAVIGNIHHVNLVKLRGFCAQGRERLLVYEYMSLGSLDRTLFGAGPVLEWQERFDIALGTARALAYLHGGCEHKIIHCDIKPENILLNEHMQVKISDFGLSKLLSPEQSSHFTTMRGTRGYLAPEWLTSSAISDKTDVYSYGMVLLEIVSGRKNCSMKTQSHSVGIDSGNDGKSTLSTVSLPCYFPLFALEMHEQKSYMELADPRLEGRVKSGELEMLVRVALCCVHEDPMLRPSMANVVSMLEGGIPMGEPRMDGLHFLRFYGRRFTEASTAEASRNPFMLFPNAHPSLSSSTSGSRNSLSYMSSQVVSGPR